MPQYDRALSIDQIKPSVQKSYSVISRALNRGARVTNVITHASRVKWSQDCPRLISFQKLERDREGAQPFSASLYQFTPGSMAIVQDMMTLFLHSRASLRPK